MDVLIKAKELGDAIANSDEMQRFKSSEISLEADTQSKALMNDYKNLQIELVRASGGKKSSEEIENMKESLLSKQRQLNEYEITLNYLTAKTEFDRMMKNINDVITFTITGEESHTPDKCGSCSGCK